MTQRNEHAADSDIATPAVTLRSPGELADALPYFMGFHPSDSLVLVAIQGDRGQFAGRVRLGIPEETEDWDFIGSELPRCLVQEVERRAGGTPPDGVVAYLCREPRPGESGRQVMESLRPLADSLLGTCRKIGLRVLEVLCLSEDRYWSYVCTRPGPDCCPAEGMPLPRPGTSVMAASATFAGIRIRGTQKDLEARLTAPTGRSAAAREGAIDDAVGEALPRLLDEKSRLGLAADTLTLVSGLITRFLEHPPPALVPDADAADDRLIKDTEAARVLVGLQDLHTRDRATLWMTGPQAAAALRLWRALARRCAGVYAPYGAAVRTLAGWVAWSLGDLTEARIALEMALAADPDCALAEILYEATGSGMELDRLRAGLRSSALAYPALGLPKGVWPPADPDATGEESVQEELFRLSEQGSGSARPGPDPAREDGAATRAGTVGEARGVAGPEGEGLPEQARTAGVRPAGSGGPRAARSVRGPKDGRPKGHPARSVPRQRRRSQLDPSEPGEHGRGGFGGEA